MGTPRQVELTGKRWKAAQAIGAMLIAGGVTTCASVVSNDLGEFLASGVAVVGIFVYLYGRIGAWWNHE